MNASIESERRRVLVTGSSGFIGSNLMDRFLSGGRYELAGADTAPPTNRAHEPYFQLVNLLDPEPLVDLLNRFRPEFVVHLAARTDLEETRDLQGYSANIAGVKNLVSAIHRVRTVRRCIFTSSQLVCRVGYIPRDEFDTCPSTLYGQSKVLTEKIVREADGGGTEWCLVRPTTVWGPGMPPHYRRFFELIRKGRYFHPGPQPRYKSYSYVGNIAVQYERLLLAARELVHQKTFYLADYEPISLRSWVDTFQECLGARPVPTYPKWAVSLAAGIGDLISLLGFRNFPLTSFRLRNILTEYVFDLSATKQVCGELPYGMRDGIEETVRWLKSLE